MAKKTIQLTEQLVRPLPPGDYRDATPSFGLRVHATDAVRTARQYWVVMGAPGGGRKMRSPLGPASGQQTLGGGGLTLDQARRKALLFEWRGEQLERISNNRVDATACDAIMRSFPPGYQQDMPPPAPGPTAVSSEAIARELRVIAEAVGAPGVGHRQRGDGMTTTEKLRMSEPIRYQQVTPEVQR